MEDQEAPRPGEAEERQPTHRGPPRHRLHAPRLSGLEKSLFVAGLTLFAGLTTQVVLTWALVSPDLAGGLVKGLAAEVFTGREGGIPTYLASGVPPLLVFQFSALQDIAAGFLVYPFFLHALHRYQATDNAFMRRVRRIEAAAHRHRHYVDRWGPMGVFLFMLVPFLVNGPLVGLVLGRVAGIPTRNLILPVAGATTAAAAAWVLFTEHMLMLAEKVLPGAGEWLAVVAVGIIVLLLAVDAVRERLRARRG